MLKLDSVDGRVDSLFNAYTTPGDWMFDEGGSEQLEQVLFDPFNNHIILGNTSIGPLGDTDIRIRALNLIQNDN